MTSIQFLTNPIDLPHLQLPESNSTTRENENSRPRSDDNDDNTASSPVDYDSSDTQGSVNTENNKIGKKNRKKTRKQRSGPSCDHCRSRKVKCDANILILEYQDLTEEELQLLTPYSTPAHTPTPADSPLSAVDPKPIGFDYQDNPIYPIPNTEWKLVRTKLDNSISNTRRRSNDDGYKYIKFKNCNNCINKNLSCNFSKGFTRIHSVFLTNNNKS